MTTREEPVAEFEHELADAVDAIISMLAEDGSLENDAEAAVRTLEAYVVQQNRIGAAAKRDRNVGLHRACALLNVNLLDLVRRGTPLSAEERTLIYGWPNALVEYSADPSNPDAVAALVLHVSDPAWSSTLSADEAESLERMLLSTAIQSSPAPEELAVWDDTYDPQQHAGFQPDTPASRKITLAASGTDPAFMTANGSFSRIPNSTSVAWMADLAGRKGLVGIQEVCEHVGRALSKWAAQENGVSDVQAECLADVLVLAKDALGEANTPALTERLLALLDKPVWPEALVGDEREMLIELLQADLIVSAPQPDVPAEEEPGEFQPGGPAAALERPAEPNDTARWLREQVVSGDLVRLLASEFNSAREALQQSLDAACTGDDTGAGDAADQYTDELARVGAAADAIGLSALHEFLTQLNRLFAGRAHARPSGQQRDMLALLPDALAAYLAAPTDRSAAEGLVDLLRSDAWPTSLAEDDAARLAQGLGLVKVSNDVATTPARQVQATLQDVSLAFPADINQELLEGLLLELPVQTGEFSNGIQNIAGGHGSLADLDTAKRAAHTLKGAANTVGVSGIANLTHHLEDILIALWTQRSMPSGALADTLVRASDCLEAMSEAVTGTGPEPDDSFAVLQDVLNWANRIDNEGIPETEEVGEPAPMEAATKLEGPNSVATSVSVGPTVRVPATLIDELLRLVGEAMISTGQIRDRLTKVVRNHQDIRNHAGAHLRLTNELEELVDVGIGVGPVRARPDNADFDPLEFDHYSELHSVSRRLIESATDAREMGAGMDEAFTELRELAEAQERLHQQTQKVVMQTRMVPVSTVLSRLQRGVRQACRLLDKEANLRVTGDETLIDSNILNELIDPLMHVLRNAVDHGIEPAASRTSVGKPACGNIELAFTREGNQVVVRCRDDGAGLDLASILQSAQEARLVTPAETLSDDEIARLILTPGFSTRAEATQVSGRGIGMDIVRSRIQLMKGSLNLHSQAGKGLTVELRLPAALISTHALIARSGAGRLALSSHGIQDIHYVLPDQLQIVAGSPTYRIGDNLLQVVEIEALLGLPADRRGDLRHGFPLLMVRLDSGALRAVRVQEVLQSRDLVVKALGRYVPKLRGVVGATILGDGSVAAVVDLPDMMATPAELPRGTSFSGNEPQRSDHDGAAASQLTALVVDDSLSARRATAQFMRDAGFAVRTAIDGLEAVSIIEKWQPDVMLVDMEMPRMSGLELTAHVRASKGALAQVPIIMITSRSTAKHRKQAEAAGVSVYLTKPFSDEDLLRHVTELTMSRHGA